MSAAEQNNQKKVEDTLKDASQKKEGATKGVDSQLNGVTKWFEGFFKSWPVLPKSLLDWLAQYAHILALIGGILSVILSLIGLFGLVLVFVGAFGLIFSFASTVISAILLLMAYSPLQAKREYGWKLLYWNALQSFVLGGVLGNLINIVPSIVGVVLAIIFGLIGLWILFGLRTYFNKK